MMQGYIYIYRGDRLTDNQYRMQPCNPILNAKGKCIRGKNGNMLVQFSSGNCVVLARQLRRIDKMIGKGLTPLSIKMDLDTNDGTSNGLIKCYSFYLSPII
jgi:hypothetical protein